MKILPRAIIVIILVSCMLTVAFAENAPQIWLSETTGAPGDVVEVTVTIQENPGFAYIKLEVGYDGVVLDAFPEDTGLLEGYVGSQTADKNPYLLTWSSAGNMGGNGVTARLKFRIPEDAKLGEQKITLRVAECWSETLDAVDITAGDGCVKVENAASVPATTASQPTQEQIEERTPTEMTNLNTVGASSNTTRAKIPLPVCLIALGIVCVAIVWLLALKNRKQK